MKINAFGKIILVYITFMLASYFYCLPDSNEVLIQVILGSIIVSLASFILIAFTKFPKNIEPEILMKQFRIMDTVTPIMFGTIFFLIMIVGIIRVCVLRDFASAAVILPSIFFMYNSRKAWNITKEQ